MGSAADFDGLRDSLDPEIYTLAAVDLRGYGDSRDLTGDFTSTEAAADAFEVANSLGWSSFAVVGHSMSGMIVQRMLIQDAAQAQPRISRAVAITPVSAAGFPADADTKAFLWSAIGDASMTGAAISMMSGHKLTSVWARGLTQRHLESVNLEAMQGFYHMWIEEDFSSIAAETNVKTPLLVIGGRNDLPGFQENHLRTTIGAWFPNASFEFITDAGHFPMFETPARLASLIDQFLSPAA